MARIISATMPMTTVQHLQQIIRADSYQDRRIIRAAREFNVPKEATHVVEADFDGFVKVVWTWYETVL